MNEVKNPIVEVKLSEDSVIHLGQYKGAFCKLQTSAYGDLVQGGLEKPIAHKVAMDYGSDIGRACATDGTFRTKVNAAKEGKGRLQFKGSSMVQFTNTMAVIRVAQVIATLADESLVASRELPPLNKELVEYLTKCAEWCNAEQVDENGKPILKDGEPVKVRTFTEKKD